MARIAVVGAGISGLACADLLGRTNDVTLFEAEARPGGHARTRYVPNHVMTHIDQQPVDTGFIVYNEVNYPLLTRLFAELGVRTQPSDMSFGVRYGDGDLEFCSSSIRGLFAQGRRTLLSPRYWGMLGDILRFFRRAPDVLTRSDEPTLGKLIDSLHLGTWFRERFLLPMGSAIWSTPPGEMLKFPAKSFVRFFANHGLLSANGQHPWRTVTGGSEQYVRRFTERLGSRLALSSPVAAIDRVGSGYEVATAGGDHASFDEIVLACHADRALSLLTTPSADQRRILGAFKFRDNEAILHSDETLMPKAKGAWASWIYAAAGPEASGRCSVTYWMNRLQSISGANLFVTLNPDRPIAAEKQYDRHVFRHPMFSQAAIVAQREIPTIQGRDGIWYCGAWCRNGFHEDGLWSAVRVAEDKGVPISWR